MTVVLDVSEGKVFVLEREVERLRAELKRREWDTMGNSGCSSCESRRWSGHADDCAVFNQDGSVK